MQAHKLYQNYGIGISWLIAGAGLRTASLPRDVVAVIKCQKDPIKALEMFNSVKMEDGFKHTLLTYKCMIEKLGFHGKFEEMENLLSEMRLNIDNGLLEGVYIGSMKNYGKKMRIQQAVDVFERMDFYNCEQSVQSYNVIMNILVDNGYFDQAHKVYMRMIHKKIVPDVYTFTIRIKSFSQMGRHEAALRLLRNMPSQGCEFNAEAYCTVIGGFYEDNNQGEAYKLFLEMYSLGIHPSVKTFNKLMHILCKKGEVQESEKLLNKVLKRGLNPNLFTFNVLIQGLCKRNELHEAIKLFESVSKEGLIPDVVTYNTLILGLSNNCKALEAENYLHMMVNDGVEPNYFTYNTIISGYCEMGMIGNADKVLSDAVFKGFVPDEFTYLSLVTGFCQAGDINRAISVVKELLVKEFKPSVLVYNRLIQGLCKKGLVLEAVAIVTKMTQFGSSPDMWTYNSVINALSKMGCLSDASCLIDNAIAEGYLPDVCTLNTLVDGYCKQRKLDNAIEIINRMWEDYGVTADVITYNSLLNGLCKARKFDDVIETFNAFLEKGCSPNVFTYNPVIESLCKLRRVDKALNLLEEMKSRGIPVDIVCVGTLLNGFCLNGDLDRAFQFFGRAEDQHKVSHTTGTFNIMINAFSENLNMNMALKIFNDMDKKNCAPDGYTYRVMIGGFCKTGAIDSGYKFLLEKIEKGFVPTMGSFGKVLNCLCMENRVQEAVGIIRIMVQQEIVPEEVNTIFEVDKKEVAAPKIVVDDLLKKSHITYSTFEVLYDGVRDRKLMRKKLSRQQVARS